MNRSLRVAILLAMLLADVCTPAQAITSTFVSILTPRGAEQAFILIKPDHPVASVILFAGGNGVLGLKSISVRSLAGNFLVRSRYQFASRRLMVAVVDAPSDRQDGMNAIFRMSRAHADDISAVAAYLRKEAAVPVWLIGTSMGTFSSAGAAIASEHVDGLVLTSTVTRSPPEWAIAKSHPNAVADMALSEITVPTLIMSHREDVCISTPAADAAMLRMRLTKTTRAEIALLDGGQEPQSEPCQAYSAHGYFGIEDRAVDTVVNFITSK